MKAKDLLNEAYYQQDRTDEMLNDVYAAKEVADNAITEWNKTITEKESIYKVLKGWFQLMRFFIFIVFISI